MATILCSLLATPARAQVTGLPADWEKGFNFTSWLPDEYGWASASSSLDGLASTGANAIAIVVTWYQPGLSSDAMAPDPARTPTDAAIRTVVARAKAKGMKVTIRPVIDSPGGWRGDFMPGSVDTWFANYTAMIDRYADLAKSTGADTLSVGVELRRLTTPGYTWRWAKLIAGVRARYGGNLVYAANLDEYRQIDWWHHVDVIGIDAYFPLSLGATPSETEIAQRWESFTDAWGVEHRYLSEIGAVAWEFARPVVFTELGYASAPDNLVRPWEIGSTYSAAEQQIAYAGAFRALAPKPWFRGVQIWDWYANPTWGAEGYPDHSPQGKPARWTLTNWFSAPPTPARSGLR